MISKTLNDININDPPLMYVRLMLQKAELEQRPKSKKPWKLLANYRAARMFLAATKSLYIATKVI